MRLSWYWFQYKTSRTRDATGSAGTLPPQVLGQNPDIGELFQNENSLFQVSRLTLAGQGFRPLENEGQGLVEMELPGPSLLFEMENGNIGRLPQTNLALLPVHPGFRDFGLNQGFSHGVALDQQFVEDGHGPVVKHRVQTPFDP